MTHRLKTRLTHIGRNPQSYYGLVNPPIAKNSTFIYKDLKTYKSASGDANYKYRYGRLGNPTADLFENAITELDGGFAGIVAPSGLAACTLPLLTYMKSGGHVLIVDSVYDPIRGFLKNFGNRFNVEVEYYNPNVGQEIESLIRPNTCLIYMESPTSAIFEVQDVKAITKKAKAAGVVTILDNTWASPLAFRPIEHGVDIALQSATKYIAGHADVTLGIVVAADKEKYKDLKSTATDIGYNGGADDIYLAIRGLRTMEMRYKQSAKSALEIAKWIKERPEVGGVFYPLLEDDKGHALWKRDFSGGAGVFSFDLITENNNQLYAFADALTLFPIGSSWGGYESLMQPQNLSSLSYPPEIKGHLLRLQIGLEDPKDLIENLEQAFDAMSKC